MTRKAIGVALLLSGLFCTFLPCFAQEEMQSVDNTAFPRPERSPALFLYDTHNENAGIDDCGTCHHVYENGRQSEVETSEDRACVECHTQAAGAQNLMPLRRAFHLKCKGCHLARNAGPILCAECHPRRS